MIRFRILSHFGLRHAPSTRAKSAPSTYRAMSFWGCVVAPGQPTKVETPAGELLHLSQACLAPDTAKGATATLIVEQGGKSFAVASLKEGAT
eukprot:4146402-Heterocapsa_arctica.AAC.1